MNNKKDYSKTIIYKITCNDENIKDVYVGSTTNFKNRKWNHKSNCNNENSPSYNYKVYKFIRDNGGWDNFSMILIENFSCINYLEAYERERYYYDILNSTLNTLIPGRIDKKYYMLKTKNKRLAYQKEYTEKNKDKIINYQKEYKTKNKDIIKEYSKKNYILNKEKKKEYYIKNKEKNKEKLREQKLNN